jgi:transposase
MAKKGLNVKEVSEIKRLLNLGLTNRQISAALKIHRNTINKYVEKIKNNSATEVVTKVQLIPHWSAEIDWENVRREFLSGVPLSIIYEEFFELKKISVQYPGFWKQANKNINLSQATMVKIHRPGERAEIDYCDGIDILDPATGEIKKTHLFVGVLCHSRFAFAEFSLSQSSSDFLQSHVNMFEYFGGVPQALSPDNLKSAVTKAHRYDPVINQAYTRLAEHYSVAVLPARVRSPTDKAIVERTIQIFQKYFFMKVRHRTFTSLLELNQCLREHLEIFNNKVHRIFKRTRKEMYEEEFKSLRSLPAETYKVAVYHKAILSRDCHLMFEQNYYSAPHQHRGCELDVWATAKIVEIFVKGDRVAVHARGKTVRKFVTDVNHYPPAHQAFAEEDVQKIINQAENIGVECLTLVKALLEVELPLKHMRRCQGIVALSWKFSPALLEGACKEANVFNNHNIQYLERVIKTRSGVKQNTDEHINRKNHNPHLRGLNNIH